MADDVTVANNSGNAGTDYTVATDNVQVGGTQAIGQVQFVKLVDGTLDGTDPIPGSLTGGLKVSQDQATAGAAPAAFTSTSSTVLLASNAGRIAATIQNDSDKDLFINLSTTAVTVSAYYARVRAAGGFFSVDNYTGQITGIMASAIGSGQVVVGELT